MKEAQALEPLMLKEIYEIPAAVGSTLDCFNDGIAQQQRIKELFKARKRLIFIGCGTAYHACLLGKHIFNRLLKQPVETEVSGEFGCSVLPPDEKSLVIAVSQSGETADTLTAVRLAKENGAAILAICNVKESSLTKEADEVIYTQAGKESAIAATKSFATQILVFYLIALLLSPKNKKTAALSNELERSPALIEETIKCEKQIRVLAKLHRSSKCALFVGRGVDFVTAKEASLKLKETSYMFSDGLAASELRHGTMALVTCGTLVAAISTQQEVAAKNEKLLCEVRERGGSVLLLTQLEQSNLSGDNCLIKLPATSEILMPLVSIIPLQLFAFWVSTYKKLNPDKPRHLTKSVTVE